MRNTNELVKTNIHKTRTRIGHFTRGHATATMQTNRPAAISWEKKNKAVYWMIASLHVDFF